jgi:hypothetical protein
MIPKSLRIWFVIHFILDMVFAIPLMIAPIFVLQAFGFEGVEVLTARVVAAALIGIGGMSLIMHKKGVEEYKNMLNLKLIWSAAASIGILWTILEGGQPVVSWFLLGIFVVFFFVWFYYNKEINKHFF